MVDGPKILVDEHILTTRSDGVVFHELVLAVLAGGRTQPDAGTDSMAAHLSTDTSLRRSSYPLLAVPMNRSTAHDARYDGYDVDLHDPSARPSQRRCPLVAVLAGEFGHRLASTQAVDSTRALRVVQAYDDDGHQYDDGVSWIANI